MAKVSSRILMNPEEQYDYTVDLRIEDIRTLHYCVQEAIRTWPGAPARPQQEQEQMWFLRDQFQRMILDYQFNNC